jgi:deoxyribonuclease V
MQTQHLHDWNLSPADAIALQRELVTQVIFDTPLPLSSVKLIAGVDVSVKNNESQAAVVVLKYPELEVIETVLARQPTPFPYIPGLLSFREGPALVEAFDKLQAVPDVFIFDGMGRAHPRRMGIAAHMGLWLQKPTIGCGKTHLTGKYTEPDATKGSYSYLTDRGETIGVVLRTKDNVKPVYISPGNLIDLDSAIEITMACTTRYRLPEPIRAAHNAAGKFD